MYCFVLLPGPGPFNIQSLYSSIQCYFHYQSSRELDVSLLYTKKKAYFFHFFVVFWAPTGQPGAPFIFIACILAYNYIFFIKVPENLMFFDCIPKKELIRVIFYLFMVVFWAPTGQPGAPFIFKACILAYNNIFFIKVLKNQMFLD